MKKPHSRVRRIFRGAAKWALCLLVCAAALALAVAGWFWWTCPRPVPPTEIFRGITYSCLRLPDSDEGSGLVHVARVDLAVPGIGLYVTPLDEEALARDFQYRLDHAGHKPLTPGLP